MLTDDVERYIALRQTLGFQLRKPARHLRLFARVATEKGEALIRAAIAIEWAAAAPTLDARNRRIGDVARFARFLRAEDSRHEVPPTGLFATPKLRPTPYIYAPDELARAVSLLKQLAKVQAGDFVFPGQARGKPLSNMAMEMMLRRLKIENATVHGFRSSFRDWAGNVSSFPREVTETAWAHVIGDNAEQAYRRSDALEKRRKLMEACASYCERKISTNVVPIRKTKPL